MPTPNQVITYAEIAQYLCLYDIERETRPFAGGIDQQLPRKIYLVRKNLSWLYDKDSADTRLIPLANYLFWLLNRWGLKAENVTGSGGTIAPISPSDTIKSPIKITGADFVSATLWNGQNYDSINIKATYTLQVFYNDIQRFLDEGTEWNRTSLGCNITLSGFSAIDFPSVVLYIYISP